VKATLTTVPEMPLVYRTKIFRSNSLACATVGLLEVDISARKV